MVPPSFPSAYGRREAISTSRARSCILGLLIVEACAPYWTYENTHADLRSDGIPVVMPRASMRTPEFEARIAKVIDTGLAYWHVPRSALDGWRIVFVEEASRCSATEAATGCNDQASHTITVLLSSHEPISTCIEETSLLHELGHLRFVDHSQHEWCGLDDVIHSFAGTAGCPGIENSCHNASWCYGASALPVGVDRLCNRATTRSPLASRSRAMRRRFPRNPSVEAT